MWDYNRDGQVDYWDEVDYWDDVYYEEHRDEYSPLFLGSSGSSYTAAKTYTNKAEKKSSESLAEGIGMLLIGILFFTGALFLAFLGIACLFFFPPLGILLMWPMYKLLGGR